MKRAPKVRWYPGWVLTLGMLCLLLAGVMFFGRMQIGERPRLIYTGPKSGVGTNFALVFGMGLLLTGIGIYALVRGKY